MRDSEFLEDGMLIKFEYYAASAGDVTFLVCIAPTIILLQLMNLILVQSILYSNVETSVRITVGHHWPGLQGAASK